MTTPGCCVTETTRAGRVGARSLLALIVVLSACARGATRATHDASVSAVRDAPSGVGNVAPREALPRALLAFHRRVAIALTPSERATLGPESADGALAEIDVRSMQDSSCARARAVADVAGGRAFTSFALPALEAQGTTPEGRCLRALAANGGAPSWTEFPIVQRALGSTREVSGGAPAALPPGAPSAAAPLGSSSARAASTALAAAALAQSASGVRRLSHPGEMAADVIPDVSWADRQCVAEAEARIDGAARAVVAALNAGAPRGEVVTAAAALWREMLVRGRAPSPRVEAATDEAGHPSRAACEACRTAFRGTVGDAGACAFVDSLSWSRGRVIDPAATLASLREQAQRYAGCARGAAGSMDSPCVAEVSATVRVDGRIDAVSIESADGVDDRCARCVARVSRGLRLPSAARSTLRYRLVLWPTAR